jgi:hypothetical protein
MDRTCDLHFRTQGLPREKTPGIRIFAESTKEQERAMSSYLTIASWSGRRKIPVDIIGETPEGFEIKALERVFLPGRGILMAGQAAIVPKTIVRVKDR